MESCPVRLKCGPHMQHSKCLGHYIFCACETCSLAFEGVLPMRSLIIRIFVVWANIVIGFYLAFLEYNILVLC